MASEDEAAPEPDALAKLSQPDEGELLPLWNDPPRLDMMMIDSVVGSSSYTLVFNPQYNDGIAPDNKAYAIRLG
jgi:hypothetical protein